MFKNMLKTIMAGAVLAFASTSAHAALYDFSYDFGGGETIVGQLEGVLQGDGDTVHVSSVVADIFTPGGPFHADTSAGYFIDQNSGGSHGTFGIVTLSGLFMDFVLHEGSHGGSCGFIDTVCLISGGGNGWIGGQYKGYDSRNWTISQAPEPATLALLGLGLVGMGFARKKAA